MSIIYLGDCHGRLSSVDKVVQSAEARGVKAIVQVGDFSVFWPGPKDALDRWIIKRAQRDWKIEILTCGGNHDNWELFDELAEEQGTDKVELYPNSGVFYVKRGSLIEIGGKSHLFLGGAETTDKADRHEGFNLWEHREEPSKEEFDVFFERFDRDKPEIIVTHDAPLRVKFKRLRRNTSVTPNMLENTLKLSKHKPKRWYFGHHHKLDKWKIGGTKFYCCGLHGQYWEYKYGED